MGFQIYACIDQKVFKNSQDTVSKLLRTEFEFYLTKPTVHK